MLSWGHQGFRSFRFSALVRRPRRAAKLLYFLQNNAFDPHRPYNHPVCSKRFRDFARRQKGGNKKLTELLGGSLLDLAVTFRHRRERSPGFAILMGK
jgi:hypothetical protein